MTEILSPEDLSSARLGEHYLLNNVLQAKDILEHFARGTSLQALIANDTKLQSTIADLLRERAMAALRFWEVARKIKQKVQEVEPNAGVIIFGSHARGDFREDSDWDVLIISDEATNKARIQEFNDAFYPLLLEENVIATAFLIDRLSWESGENPSPLIVTVREEGIPVR